MALGTWACEGSGSLPRPPTDKCQMEMFIQEPTVLLVGSTRARGPQSLSTLLTQATEAMALGLVTNEGGG